MGRRCSSSRVWFAPASPAHRIVFRSLQDREVQAGIGREGCPESREDENDREDSERIGTKSVCHERDGHDRYQLLSALRDDLPDTTCQHPVTEGAAPFAGGCVFCLARVVATIGMPSAGVQRTVAAAKVQKLEDLRDRYM